jgi:D,D-heptose 1,7-bisphosphate phosphatase
MLRCARGLRHFRFGLAGLVFYGTGFPMQTPPLSGAPLSGIPPRHATLTQAVLIVEDAARVAADIAGKPLLTWRMRELQRFGVTDFIVLGVAGEAAQSALDHASFGLPKPPQLRFGPAGLWREVMPHLNARFLLCQAEMLFDGNLAVLLADFAQDATGTPFRALVHMGNDAPCGLWAVECAGLNPDAAIAGALGGAACVTRTNGFLADLRTDAGVHAATHDLPAIAHRPALFLDRDGVLNHDHGYVGTREKWDWIPGALEAVKLATDHGWHVFVVTNQSGVARGLYSEDDVKSLLNWMEDEVRRHGGTIDDVRYCPSHPEATVPAYRRDDDWRKPGPGMILNLIADWDLNPQHCVLVGDQDTDMQAARAAGIAGVIFDGVNLLHTVQTIVVHDGTAAVEQEFV